MPVTPPPGVASTGTLTRELEYGMQGDDIAQLQLFLLQDKEIYPEGIANGRFGPATQRAVKRFQAKYGLSQVGRVGPATLVKLIELMR